MTALNATTAEPITGRGAISAWILYDVASSAYALMIPAVAYAVYFRSYVAGDSPAADAIWGMTVALPLIAAGLLGPLLGAIADLRGNRKRLLAMATLVTAMATALMATVGKGDVLFGAVVFFVAHLGYMVATGLYDSYLPAIASPDRAARISGLGWGLGYIGGIAVFLITLPLTRGGFSAGNAGTFALTFAVTGGFYLLLALPALLRLPAGATRKGRADVGIAYRRVWSTVRGWRHDVEVPKFLLAYYLINDAVVTVALFTPIVLSAAFGMGVQELLALTLLFNAIALPATIAFGWLGDRWSHRGAVYVTLVVWAITLGIIGYADGPWVPRTLAVLLGLVIGSTQSLLRAMFARMVPTEQAAEYFGFHSLVGKVSTALGPLVFGLVSTTSGNQRTAMLSLGAFFVAGALVLWRVRLK
jgi:UMF1 family MFS transporter